MTMWRPQQHIQVKALGLVWRDGLLLAGEIYRDDGTVKGVRPLGGSVEFGETWQNALVREFDEELGVAVTVIGKPIVLENIYAHQGVAGHEIIFVSELTSSHDVFRDEGPITYFEDNGQECRAIWCDVDALDCGGLELYPSGLKAELQKRTAG